MVNNFFGFSLKTGALIIGGLGAAMSLFHVITSVVIIIKVDDVVKDYNATGNDPITSTMVLANLSIFLSLNIINCVASTLLVKGAIQERDIMLVPWLVNSGIGIVFFIMNIAGFTILSLYQSNSISLEPLILFLIISGIMTGFQYYCWSAIYSLYEQLGGN